MKNPMKFVKWFVVACLVIIIICAVSLDIDYVAGWAGLLGLIVACLPTNDEKNTASDGLTDEAVREKYAK